ncbi:MAG TPA: aldose 1-epimerase [Isosphaeraceae bacterium]|jgi:aldose 1-epimerase|nr:aldose 1-epimerase [Isosphaeraceae bacterium]
MSYSIRAESRGGGTVYLLGDTATGASASILPSYGFNLFDLRLPLAGQPRRVVVAGDGWEDAPDRPARNGVPILFPYPGRIRDACYTFGGKEFRLPATKPPHAIHGFAHEASWEVVAHEVGAAGATITGRLQLSKQVPAMAPLWPTDAVLEVTYTLAGRRLRMDIAVSNPTDAPLPFGFGIHPYFRLPFEPGGDPRRTLIVAPASECWVLSESLPTGERRPVGERHDFRRGRPMSDVQVDDVLTGLEFAGDGCTCRLIDEALGAEFRLEFDRAFRELVVFTPPGPGGVIAVEPYTQVPDAIHLQAQGIDAGLRVLAPGQRADLAIAMESSG